MKISDVFKIMLDEWWILMTVRKTIFWMGVESWYLRKSIFLNLWDLENIMVPLKVPTPTPAQKTQLINRTRLLIYDNVIDQPKMPFIMWKMQLIANDIDWPTYPINYLKNAANEPNNAVGIPSDAA